MAQPQIVIIYDENGYIRDLVKYLDNTLTDDDILSINTTLSITGEEINISYEPQRALEYVAATFVPPFPIVISPLGNLGIYQLLQEAAAIYYPDILLCQPYAGTLNYGGTDFPVTINPSNGWSGSHVLLTGSGLNGVHKWVGSTAIEFIVDSNGFSKNTFAITNITQQSGGKIRLFHDHAYMNYYLVAYEQVHVTGVTGFGNNPDGFYSVFGKSAAGVTPKWIDVKFVAGLGGGTYGGGATGHITFLSDTPAVVGVKLNKIKRAREFANGSCSWWEARYLARLYSTGEGDKAELDGYGDITSDTITDAIAHSGEIPDDPYLPLGETGEISLSYNNATGLATIRMPTIENALHVELLSVNSLGQASVVRSFRAKYQDPYAYSDFSEIVTTLYLRKGLNRFAYRGTRHSESTGLSEIYEYTPDEYNVPDYDFEIGDTVYALTKNKITGVLQINDSKVIARERYIDDSKGLIKPKITEYYTLSEGDVIEGRFIGFTTNHLLYKMSQRRFNDSVDLTGTIQYLTPSVTDVCGLQLDYADLTNTDFTGWYIHGTSFFGCTMAENADTKEKLRSIVAGYDSETTVWTDGTLLSAD